jgi:hypothetical protein
LLPGHFVDTCRATGEVIVDVEDVPHLDRYITTVGRDQVMDNGVVVAGAHHDVVSTVRHRAGRASGHAKALKHARYALWKNPENLTGRPQAKLA